MGGKKRVARGCWCIEWRTNKKETIKWTENSDGGKEPLEWMDQNSQGNSNSDTEKQTWAKDGMEKRTEERIPKEMPEALSQEAELVLGSALGSGIHSTCYHCHQLSLLPTQWNHSVPDISPVFHILRNYFSF